MMLRVLYFRGFWTRSAELSMRFGKISRFSGKQLIEIAYLLGLERALVGFDRIEHGLAVGRRELHLRCLGWEELLLI